MSTEFRTTDTDEFAFVRWCKDAKTMNADGEPNGAAFDFGCFSRAVAVRESAAEGRTFTGEDGSVFTAAEVEQVFARDRATFGEFRGTCAVDGTGEFFTRSTEQATD
jgi:hypothetical protein